MHTYTVESLKCVLGQFMLIALILQAHGDVISFIKLYLNQKKMWLYNTSLSICGGCNFVDESFTIKRKLSHHEW